ncbi:hypothetical protein GXP67_33160 [Rhodocytophaga rosea]|uniref:Uncharacterized protein n=1 Tax=Rhodocytophaga rosea TaxID=2704465 RepID=A0A6C0GUZ3_9BACT|nr:hypothetical protein [Rhodocytophaga rosea]QHT71160.1 hypothetical protein GXP67_33160 [Rhodocytophaga rosea]
MIKNPFILRLAFLLSLFIIYLSSCRSHQLTSQADADTGRQVIFGSGGGFSGQVIEYTLLENGQLSRTNSLSKEKIILKALPKKEAQSYFEQAEQLHLGTMNFKHPGNLYYFIRLKKGEKAEEVLWGNTDHPVPAQVRALYESLENDAAQK